MESEDKIKQDLTYRNDAVAVKLQAPQSMRATANLAGIPPSHIESCYLVLGGCLVGAVD